MRKETKSSKYRLSGKINLWRNMLRHILIKQKKNYKDKEKILTHNKGKSKNNITGNSNKVAAAAAKSLQSCPTLSDPVDYSLPGSSVHGIFQARVLEWGAIAFSPNKVISWFFSRRSAGQK